MLTGEKSFLDAERNRPLFFPTEAHRSFVSQITEICRQMDVSAMIKGSLAKGTAQKRSDIDLILLGVETRESLDAIISSYGAPILSEHSSYSSTYMVIYESGLAVEFDIRKTITSGDLAKSLIIYSSNLPLSERSRDRLDVNSLICPRRENDYSEVMIAQMCCSKLLCNKPQMAKEIYCDRMEYLTPDHNHKIDKQAILLESQQQFACRLFQIVSSSKCISQRAKTYLLELFNEIK